MAIFIFTSDTPHYENVPQGWECCRFDDLCSIFSTGPFGSMVHKSDYVDIGGIPLVNPVNIIDGKIRDKKLMRVNYVKAEELGRYKLCCGDILIARRGDLSKCAIITAKEKNWLCGTGSFFLHVPYVLPHYIEIFYTSEYVQSRLKQECVGATMDNLNQNVLGSILFLLPPVAEQKRIIDAVEQWYSLINVLENEKNDLSTTIQQAKNKILDLAIHGKLVPQTPNDEPASELLKHINPKAEITCDNGQYGKLPKGWGLSNMSDIFLLNPKNVTDDETEVGFIPMALVEDGFSGKHSFKTRTWKEVKQGFCHFQNGDIGVAKISPCFENLKSCIFSCLPNNIGAGTTELVILRSRGVFAPFYLYMCKSDWYISQGTKYFKGVVGQQRVNKEIFTNLQVPLPPFAEQQRIVQKIEELFSVLDYIQKALEV